MTAVRWAAGRLGQTEAPPLWLSIIRCPARSRGTLAVSGNLVSSCSYPAVEKMEVVGPTKLRRCVNAGVLNVFYTMDPQLIDLIGAGPLTSLN